MRRTAWIIGIGKTPEGKWRALKPIWSKRYGKPIVTQWAHYKGTEIETPGGHYEIEWYEGGNGSAVKLVTNQQPHRRLWRHNS